MRTLKNKISLAWFMIRNGKVDLDLKTFVIMFMLFTPWLLMMVWMDIMAELETIKLMIGEINGTGIKG